MLSWIKKVFQSRESQNQVELSEKLIEVATMYVQLVKSRIVEALISEEAALFYTDVKAPPSPLLMPILCAYFAARTDYELERRKVSKNIREEIWSELIDAVLEEMDISNHLASTLHPLIFQQMGLVRGIIETKGVTDYEAVSNTLVVMASVKNQVVGEESKYTPNINHNRVIALLQKYEGYASYLNTIATESQSDG